MSAPYDQLELSGLECGVQAEDIVLNVVDVNLESGIASVQVQAEPDEEVDDKVAQLVASVKKCGFDAEPRH